MGFGSSLKKAVKKAAKSVEKVAKSAVTVVATPIKAAGQVLQGDLSGATQEIGKGVGAAINTASRGVLDSGTAQKILNNDVVSALTLNTSKEIATFGRGARDLENTGEADRRFYQATMALGAKAGAAALAVAAAPQIVAGVKTLGGVVSGKTAVGVAVGTKLLKGDVQGAVAETGEVGGIVSELLPDKPPPALGPAPSYDSGGGSTASPGGSEAGALMAAAAIGSLFLMKGK